MLYNATTNSVAIGPTLVRKKIKSKLQFPSWRAVMRDVLENAQLHHPADFDAQSPDYRTIADNLNLLREVILSRNTELLFSRMPSYDGTYKSDVNLEEVLALFKALPIRPNEFYAVFDLKTAQYREMDDKLDSLTGIPWKTSSAFDLGLELKKAP